METLPEAAPVLYVDPVRPLAAIAEALSADRSRLGNLMILAADNGGAADLAIETEIKELEAEGSTPRLVIINEIGRFTAKRSAKDFAIPGGTTSVLLVLAEPKYRTHPKWRRFEKVEVVDMMASEKVITLQPDTEETVRLSIFEYGELKSELAVEPKGNWKSLGVPEVQARNSRQDKVLSLLVEAAADGLPAGELAALAGITVNNLYQAARELKRSDKVVAKGRKYYAKAFEPEATADQKPKE